MQRGRGGRGGGRKGEGAVTEAEEWSHSTITGSICTLQAFPCLYLTESSTQLCCGCCSLFTGGENALRGETVLGSRCLQLSPALPWALMSEFKPATPAVRAELLDAPEAASNSGPHMLTHDLCFGVLHLHPSFEAREARALSMPGTPAPVKRLQFHFAPSHVQSV